MVHYIQANRLFLLKNTRALFSRVSSVLQVYSQSKSVFSYSTSSRRIADRAKSYSNCFIAPQSTQRLCFLDTVTDWGLVVILEQWQWRNGDNGYFRRGNFSSSLVHNMLLRDGRLSWPEHHECK